MNYLLLHLKITENVKFCVLLKYLGFLAKESKEIAKTITVVCALPNHQREGLKSSRHHPKELLSVSVNNIFAMKHSTGLLSCHRVPKLPLSDRKSGD